jgi:predicted TIM-barrel fold metal-dependent hydrolase
MGDALGYPVISADSHITEAPNTYIDYIDPAYRGRAPHMVDGGEGVGDLYVIEGMDRPVPMGLVAAAGKAAEDIRVMGVKFDELHRSGWDPTARMADQQRDGVSAEIIYPTVGMQLCNHPDFDYKKACFDAYNRWIAEYSSADPNRLICAGQTSMRSPEEGIADLQAIKDLGLRGVMMPGEPNVADYDDPVYDPFWEAAVDLGLPLSFHILTGRSGKTRGPRMNSFLSIVRGCQDIMGMLVLGGVFERHPKLKVVCVEADAGWVPHFMYRMDHAYKRHRYWLAPGQELSKLPSEYFAEVTGDARRAHGQSDRRAAQGHPLRQRGRALQDRHGRAGNGGLRRKTWRSTIWSSAAAPSSTAPAARPVRPTSP